MKRSPLALAALPFLILAAGCIGDRSPGEVHANVEQRLDDPNSLDPEQLLHDVNDYVKDPYGNLMTDAEGELIEWTTTAISVAYPGAGVVLGAMESLFGMAGAPGAADPMAQAIAKINERLAILETRLHRLEARQDELRRDLFKNSNQDRIRWLHDRHQELRDLVSDAQYLTDASNRAAIASRAVHLAARYLKDDATGDFPVWSWSDLQIVQDEDGNLVPYPLNEDFKPLPVFEYYTSTLTFLMAAIRNEGLSRQAVIDKYGPDLLAHAHFLSVRPYWDRASEPADTLFENVLGRLDCREFISSNYPDDQGMCHVTTSCRDYIARKRGVALPNGSFDFRGSDDSFCTFTPTADPQPESDEDKLAKRATTFGTDALALSSDMDRRIFDSELGKTYGLTVMTRLADELGRLGKTGTVDDRPPSQLLPGPESLQLINAVQSDGTLLQFIDRTRYYELPVDNILGLGPVNLGDALRSGAVGRSVIEANAQLNAPRVILGHEFDSHSWAGAPVAIGWGWNIFQGVYPGGGPTMYGMTPDGLLRWYRYDGMQPRQYGSPLYRLIRPPSTELVPTWAPIHIVGSGWTMFSHIVGAGNGVFYGITPQGSVRWYQHAEYKNATDPPTWRATVVTPPTPAGAPNWKDYIDVVASSNGVLYAIAPDGRLFWYHHLGYQTGVNAWEGPREVGSGWQNFKRIFSPGRGLIYAITQEGELLLYENLGDAQGTGIWRDTVDLGAGWGDYLQVWAQIDDSTPTNVH